MLTTIQSKVVIVGLIRHTHKSATAWLDGVYDDRGMLLAFVNGDVVG